MVSLVKNGRASKKVYNERYDECNKCDRLTFGKRCLECGCYMQIKAKIKSVKCPLGKW